MKTDKDIGEKKEDSLENQPCLIEGTVQGTRESYGWLKSGSDSFFIPPPQMSLCFNGDIVKAHLRKDDFGRTEIEIDSIVKSDIHSFVGEITRRSGHQFIQPKNPLIKQRFIIPLIERDEYADGDIVQANVTHHPFESAPKASITGVISNKRDPFSDWKVSAANHNIAFNPRKVDPHAEMEDQGLYEKSANLTHLPFITIDGEHTREIDDAVYAHQEAGFIHLYVAIADPNRYIRKGSEIDLIAKEAGSSAFFPGISIPMLPTAISENAASLIEHTERQVICCQMKVDQGGEVIDSRFVMARIVVHKRLDYDEVQALLDTPASGTLDDRTLSNIQSLHAFQRSRTLWRKNNNIPCATYTQQRLVMEYSVIQSIELSEQSVSQKIIEECMVAANIAFASFMQNNQLPCVYRRHDGFRIGSHNKIAQCLSDNGIPCLADRLGDMDYYNAVRADVSASAKQDLTLRIGQSMGRGYYSLEPGPHLAMGVGLYANFSSPIRRYADLVNHRTLRSYLMGVTEAYPLEAEDDIAEHLNQRQQAVDKAVDEVKNNLLHKYHLSEANKGKTLSATVISLTQRKIRVEMGASGARATLFIHDIRLPHGPPRLCEHQMTLFSGDTPFLRLGDIIDVQVTGTYSNGQKLVAVLKN